MSGPQEPAEGTNGRELWFTPEERLRMLQRAYPPRVAWHAYVWAWLSGILQLVGIALAVSLSPVLLAWHALLRALGRNGIVHANPAGHGLVWLANVHMFKRCSHGPTKLS